MRLIGILIFFAMLSLPSIFWATGCLDSYQIDENRTRAAWPRSEFMRDPTGYFVAAGRWFDDHFGGRDFLIRLKTQIDYSVFDTSTRVHIGKDGWLFYRSVLDTEKPAMERHLATNGVALTSGIAQLAQALKARDVHLILMPVLLGDVFYRQELPRSVPNLPETSRFQRAIDQWQKIPDVTIFESAPILRRIQASRPTFHKTDFHWNEPAGFEVSHAFVDMIAQREGLKTSPWNHTLAVETRDYSGKEATFLPLFTTPSEKGLFVKPTWSEPSLSYSKTQGIYEFVSTQTASDRPILPATCIIGDSFFDGFSSSGFAAYFRNIYFVRWRSEKSLYDILEQMPADCRYLLVEFIEVQFPAITGLTNGANALKLGTPAQHAP